ncbi:MAG TPA: hypothetical protein VKC66_04025 [Xanthobacteraceae bacterium]|nr:hypothetical protein [Xanthobacteraceae bacterium]
MIGVAATSPATAQREAKGLEEIRPEMCDECEEFPVQYVAYFNKAGGKLWRPAQKTATTPWAIDIRPVDPAPCPPSLTREVRQFSCDAPPAPPSAMRKVL